MGIETARHLEFHSDLKDKLMVRHFVGTEELGDCFEYSVTLYSTASDVKLEALLGKSVTVEVRLGTIVEPRYFNGIVTEFSYLGTEETYSLYRVIMRPWLWLLSHASGCEVFQNLSALDIARDMFGKGNGDKPSTQLRAETRSEIANFDDGRLFPKPKPREYCVQYRESDLDFVHRLFEEEGIYYYFKHELGKHTLVLSDAIACHDAVPGFEVIEYGKVANEKLAHIGQFYEWTSTKRVRTGIFKMKDYDPDKSLAPLEVQRSHPKEHPNNKWEVYSYPGRYKEDDPGNRFAQLRLEESHATHEVMRGVTDCTRLHAGALFILNHQDRKALSREYLIATARYDVDSGSYQSGGAGSVRMTTHVTAIPSEVQFRPARTTPRPFVAGPQVAKVVGPKDQELWTDPLGRVKIQFRWDREGKYDENSSCFVRVSQAWAGTGFGGVHVPRIGQEVLVGFIDGDLDKPIIVGRVYNDKVAPPKDWKLPAGATMSGIRSHTVKGGEENYNEFRFEDAKGKEEVYLRAERDQRTRVRRDKTTTVGNSQTHTVKKDINVTVEEGEYTVAVKKGPMFTEVPEAEFQVNSKFITGNVTEDVTLIAGPCKIFMDKTKIVLTAFENTITLDVSGIEIKGLPTVRINN